MLIISRISILIAACIAELAYGHMEMVSPAPRRSKNLSSGAGDGLTDYSMTAPLMSDGSNFPCKAYPAGKPVASYSAGDVIPVQMGGSASHGGGHCQFSLSYNDRDFVALKTIIHDCFIGAEGKSIQVKLPENTPPCDRCTFSWSWVNAQGNREFYQNCADISIVNNKFPASSLTGKQMTVANLAGYPVIAEWPPATVDGRELYDQSPVISISPSGQSGYASSAPPNVPRDDSGSMSAESVPTASAAKVGDTNPSLTVYPTIAIPDAAVSAPPSNANPADSGSCKNGDMKCVSDTEWLHCANGVWFRKQVAGGTKCRQNGNMIEQAFA